MIERMVGFFPPDFTAIAQWLVCSLHILCSANRIQNWKAAALIAFSLPVLMALNIAHADQQGVIWILVMISCMLYMMLFLRLGMKGDTSLVLQHWAHALMQAEFAASLAYLITTFLVSRGILNFPDIPAYHIVMAFVYLLVLTPLGLIMYKRERRQDKPLKISRKDVFINILIAIGAFALSNISFWASETIFDISMGGGVLIVRAVSDFSGMIALFAVDEYGYAAQLKMNLSVLENMLDNQYAQYQQFKANNDHMQQVYHDVKHLINYIRSVSSSQKYEKELRNMEDLVSNYEAQYDTGNSVLDVVLSNKKMLCRNAGITLECYIDAQEMGFLDAAHICSIFGNALDNAIEYESKIDEIEKRLIKISVFSENQFLIIHISNYCEQPVLQTEEGLVTTKPHPERHGFGIKGMRLAVENYNGHMNVKQENKWFVVSILIPIPTRQAAEEA